MSRLEAWTLGAALLSRVLHRFFQLDVAYFQVSTRWSVSTVLLSTVFFLQMAVGRGLF